jgi:ABC-type antimicrobial peptide transport system permease subunit
LGDSVSAPLRSSTTLTLVMIVILWIAACAAVAGLALSLTLQRVDELSIRKAIGASTSHIIRAACLEYVLIGVAGLIGAIAVSQWVAGGMRLIGLTPPAYHHDWALTLAAVLSLVCTAVGSAMVAVAIAWNRSGPKQRVTTTLARVPRNLLVSTQVVMALAVVGVAAMLLAGLVQLRSVNPGFNSNHAAYLTISLPPRYATPQLRAQFWNQVIDNVRTAAGITDAAITSELPFTGQQNPTAFRATTRDGQEASVQLRSVSPSYFRTAGITMHRGRAFSIDDDAKHSNVIVINEALARMMFGMRDPIGERLTLNFTMPPFEAEVIGVATNIRHSGPADPEAPEVYAVSLQTPLPRYTVLVRSDLSRAPCSPRSRARYM